MLVSVVVVAYNSAAYLEECLESIKVQSYNEIELIVTDDCSKDNTVEIANKWIETNRQRFVSARVIETPKNTGVAGNCNRGLNAVSGDWAKFIAGDDLLADEHTIETYVKEIPQDQRIGSVFSDIFQLKDGEKKSVSCKNRDIMFGNGITALNQYKILIKENFLPATSAFFYVPAIKDVGGYDETIPMCEDGVLWINLTKKGYLLYYMNKSLVVYRIHGSSLSGQFHNSINVRILDNQIKVIDKYKIPGHQGAFKYHFIFLKRILRLVCRLAGRNDGIAHLLLLFYRIMLHQPNRVYFAYLRLKYGVK